MRASTANVVRYLNKISEMIGDALIVCSYEAGPTGFTLCRNLQKQGFACVIIAPTSIAKTAKRSAPHGHKSKRILSRQEGASSEIINYADKAAARIRKKMNHLKRRGLNCNKAAVAGARELACFAWGMMTGNIA